MILKILCLCPWFCKRFSRTPKLFFRISSNNFETKYQCISSKSMTWSKIIFSLVYLKTLFISQLCKRDQNNQNYQSIARLISWDDLLKFNFPMNLTSMSYKSSRGTRYNLMKWKKIIQFGKKSWTNKPYDLVSLPLL